MNALPNQTRLLSPPPSRVSVPLDELAACVRALDPGSRALLDLSLRRRFPFEAMAGVLHTDPFDLARRRARAVARIAAELDLEGSGVVATVKAALARLPDDAWGVPEPVRLREAVQAESMAEAARALMVKLAEHRARDREAAAAREQPTVEMDVVVPDAEPADQPTVESAAVQAWKPAPGPPVAATAMAAAFAHHPAFAVETAYEATALPPPAQALARAAASERKAAQSIPAVPQPEARTPAPEPVRPAPQQTAPPSVAREPSRRLARGGLLVGLLLWLVRLLVGRR